MRVRAPGQEAPQSTNWAKVFHGGVVKRAAKKRVNVAVFRCACHEQWHVMEQNGNTVAEMMALGLDVELSRAS